MTFTNLDLELQPFAAAVVDASAALEQSNSTARDLWSRRQDLFQLAHGRLTLLDGGAQSALMQLIKQNASTRMVIRVADPEPPLLHWLVVRKLPQTPIAPPAATQDRFLISFRIAEELAASFVPDRIADDLGLTPTEGRLAAALACGRSLRNFAEAEAMKTTTARWHLDNARRKLGCANQADLVRVVTMVSL